MSGEAHSVKRHLRVDAEGYDVQIRRFIPHYDEMIATGVEVLAALAPADAHVLDLGGGTGALSSAVLDGCLARGSRCLTSIRTCSPRPAGDWPTFGIGSRFSKPVFWIRCRRRTRLSLPWRSPCP